MKNKNTVENVIRSYAFFKTSEDEILKITKIAEDVCGDNEEKLEQLSKLLEWTATEVAFDEAYNNFFIHKTAI